MQIRITAIFPAAALAATFLATPSGFGQTGGQTKAATTKKATTTKAAATQKAGTATKTGAAKAKAPARKPLTPAALRDTAPAEFKARFATTKGDFVVTVHRDWAPLGADRFYNLVKYGFYDGCSFFRVLPNFVVQFGMHPTPAVQARWQNANIKDDPVKQSNRLGYVVFATAGPNTRTTQLFINLKDNKFLDSQGFAPFGEVTEGIGVVAKIYSGYGETPDQDRILKQGDAYLKKSFPNLDSIKKATIE